MLDLSEEGKRSTEAQHFVFEKRGNVWSLCSPFQRFNHLILTHNCLSCDFFSQNSSNALLVGHSLNSNKQMSLLSEVVKSRKVLVVIDTLPAVGASLCLLISKLLQPLVYTAGMRVVRVNRCLLPPTDSVTPTCRNLRKKARK